MLQELPQRACYGIRLEPCRCYLVEKWLKSMIIMPVKQHYLKTFIFQSPRKLYSPEAPADNYDSFFGGRWNSY